jgi:hypothetical protein
MMILVLAVVLTPLLPLVVLAVRVFEAVTAEIQLAVVAVMLNVTKPLLSKVK